MIILLVILFFAILFAFIDAASDAMVNNNKESGLFAATFFGCLIVIGMSLITTL